MSGEPPAVRDDVAIHGRRTHEVVAGARHRAAGTGEISHAGHLARRIVFGAQAVMPSFALKGVDFNKVWINDLNDPKSDKPISGGPFYLPNGGWNRGKDLTLLRNPKYWGPKAKLTKVVYRFLPHSLAPEGALRGPVESLEDAAELGLGGVPPAFADGA